MFQLRQGRYADIPPAKLSEMMKSNSLDVSHPVLYACQWTSLDRIKDFLGGFLVLCYFRALTHLIFAECPNSVPFECCEWNSR